METDDDVLIVLEMKEKPFQAVGAMVLLGVSASELGDQEAMITCDRSRNMKRIAEPLLE